MKPSSVPRRWFSISTRSVEQGQPVKPKKTFRLQYLSDIHLEKYGNALRTTLDQLKPRAPNLALLGDIGCPFEDNYQDFLLTCARRYDHVYLVSGNHEYYGASIRATNRQINKVCELAPKKNLHFLQNTLVSSDPTSFDAPLIAGCTLWSEIDAKTVPHSKDFERIWSAYQRENHPTELRRRPLTLDEYLALHRRDVAWLKGVITKAERPLIVLTHHLPSYRMISPRFYSPSHHHDAFASNLYDLFQPPLVSWLCGHTHDNREILINNVYCGVNAARHINFDRVLEIQY